MTNSSLRIRTSPSVEINTENAVAAERNNAVGVEMKKSVSGLHLVHVSRKARLSQLREATTGRPVAVPRTVPRIMAVAEPVPASVTATTPARPDPKVELAFYRKYTEAMLRRYIRISMQPGRTPSLLGRELFRGDASHTTMTSFEDGVVFCLDIERCLKKLEPMERKIIQRIALQGHTLQEAAPLLGMDFRRCHERYVAALDQLTELFLAGRLLEPLKTCQDVETV